MFSVFFVPVVVLSDVVYVFAEHVPRSSYFLIRARWERCVMFFSPESFCPAVCVFPK